MRCCPARPICSTAALGAASCTWCGSRAVSASLRVAARNRATTSSLTRVASSGALLGTIRSARFGLFTGGFFGFLCGLLCGFLKCLQLGRGILFVMTVLVFPPTSTVAGIISSDFHGVLLWLENGMRPVCYNYLDPERHQYTTKTDLALFPESSTRSPERALRTRDERSTPYLYTTGRPDKAMAISSSAYS